MQEVKDLPERREFGVEDEIRKMLAFLNRSFPIIFLSGICGLASGLWLAFSKSGYSSGSMFHNFEIYANIAEVHDTGSPTVHFRMPNTIRMNGETTSFLKSKFLAAFKQQLPYNQDYAITANFVENISALQIQFASSSNLEQTILENAVKKSFDIAFVDLKQAQEADEAKSKAYVLALQNRLFDLYQKQEQTLSDLLSRRNKNVRVPFSESLDWTNRANDGDTFAYLRQLAALINQTDLSPDERSRIQSEFYDSDFEILKVSGIYKSYLKSDSYRTRIEQSLIDYRVTGVIAKNTSVKEINKRLVICLSALCGGLVLGLFFCLLKERLKGLLSWLKQLKSQME